MTHTLGAVNAARAARDHQGHCTDGYDVMCYSDGGTQSTPYSTTACPQIAGSAGMTQTYDCGSDDYFNPSPAPGSYLATHWNLYNNVFESSCATIGFACGADSAALPAGVSVPRVTGTRKVTNTLTADRGTWSGTPTSFAYQWQRSTGGNPFADIAGATAATLRARPRRRKHTGAGGRHRDEHQRVGVQHERGILDLRLQPAAQHRAAVDRRHRAAPERPERDQRHVDREHEQEPQVAAPRGRDVDRHRRPDGGDLHARVG